MPLSLLYQPKPVRTAEDVDLNCAELKNRELANRRALVGPIKHIDADAALFEFHVDQGSPIRRLQVPCSLWMPNYLAGQM